MTAPRAPALRYGDRIVAEYLPRSVLDSGRLVGLQLPPEVDKVADVDAALRRALERTEAPDLGPSLRQWLSMRYRGGDVTVIVDDHTRPCVHQRRLLPPLLKWLLAHGVRQDRIAILVATATHRPPRLEEYGTVLGEEVWSRWRGQVVAHEDTKDLERLGTMDDGVPVEVNGRAARSEVLLGLSDLDYHYFAGVTGGPKQIVPGIAGRALTTADHLRMFGPLGFAEGCDMGLLDGNPVYEYKVAAVRIVLAALRARGAFAYGVMSVLDPRHRFIALRGGDVVVVHRQLRAVLDGVYTARIPRRADIAIVSAQHLGLNAYQAGKAINTAARAVRPGGKIVCLAPCPDGIGNEEFRDLMAQAATLLSGGHRGPTAEGFDRALRAIQDAVMRDFRIGKQKSVDLLLQLRHVGPGHLFLLTDGLTEAERKVLPFRYLGPSGVDPAERLRAWVAEQEEKGTPTYAVVDDPTYWLQGPRPAPTPRPKRPGRSRRSAKPGRPSGGASGGTRRPRAAR